MANTEKVVKLTKKDFYAAIKEFIVMSEETKVGNLDAEEVIAFIDKTVEQIENKAAKAKEKAAEKKATGDRLYEVVVSALTADLQTIDEITTIVAGIVAETDLEAEEITKSKVTARLTKAVGAGVACKEQVKGDSGRRVMAYALKGEEVAEEVVE